MLRSQNGIPRHTFGVSLPNKRMNKTSSRLNLYIYIWVWLVVEYTWNMLKRKLCVTSRFMFIGFVHVQMVVIIIIICLDGVAPSRHTTRPSPAVQLLTTKSSSPLTSAPERPAWNSIHSFLSHKTIVRHETNPYRCSTTTAEWLYMCRL